MTQKKARHMYYLRGLAPAFVAALIMFLMQASLLSISTFITCYLWPYFIFTPGSKDKYGEYRYRWSLVGLIIRFQDFLENALPGSGSRRKVAIALASPIVICLFLWGISQAGEPLFALGGGVLFVLTYRYLLSAIISSASFVENSENQLAFELEETGSEPVPAVQNHQKDNDLNS